MSPSEPGLPIHWSLTPIHYCTSEDGTQIAYRVAGRGPIKVVLAPGLGGPFISWAYLIDYLSEQCTFVTWDPRGTYSSERPKDLKRLGVPDHVADMEAVLRAVAFEKCAVIGWSMGVQLALEYAYRHPNSVFGLVLIAGSFGGILGNVLGLSKARRVALPVLWLLRAFAPFFSPFTPYLGRLRITTKILERLGYIKNNAESFAFLVKEFSTLHFPIYLRMIERLDEHSSAPYLESIHVPTLVIAGEDDVITPPSVMAELARTLPKASFVVLPNATHYLLIEYPEVVSVAVANFLARLKETWAS